MMFAVQEKIVPEPEAEVANVVVFDEILPGPYFPGFPRLK
jgi:hypothetical protein